MSTASAPTPNGASVVPSATPASAAPSGKASQKLAPTAKGLDARKQTTNSADTAQRLPPTQKAWTSGTNPLTQRPLSMSRPNGSVLPSKTPPEPKQATAASASPINTPKKQGSDKMIALLGSFVGRRAKITLRGGEQFIGIFSIKSLDTPQYFLKMTSRASSPSAENVNGTTGGSDDFIGDGDDYTMAFDTKDVIDLEVLNVSMEKAPAGAANGLATGFRTDTDISSGKLSYRERQLKQWQPTSDDSNVDLSLQSTAATSWNQFDTNEKKYGVKSTYDENLYTTEIDRSKPISKTREAQINKMVRDIESGKPNDAHGTGAEDDDEDLDEESMYSSVRREYPSLTSSQGHKYTPPARRAPTGQATVSGAPVDPAIISSQLVRPETTSKLSKEKVADAASQATPETATSTADNSTPTDASEKTTGSETRSSNKDSKPEVVENVVKSSTSEVATVPGSSTGTTPNATANVERDVLESYKTWAVQEKMKLQLQRTQAAKREKELKLNDLRKFSTNFKLKTAVPPDLVPILAKDKQKQEEIKAKAQRQVEAQSVASKPVASTTDQNARSVAGSQVENVTESSGPGNDRTGTRANRQSTTGYANASPRTDRSGQFSSVAASSSARPLGHRLAQNHQQHREKAMHLANISQPQPIPIPTMPPSGPAAINTDLSNMHSGSALQSPNSALGTKFNAKAIEFRPNAPSFTPVGNQSPGKSDLSAKRDRVSQRRPNFLESRKDLPASQRSSINDAFNPIRRMKKEVAAEKKQSDYASNGGIPQAYRTLPTWEVAPENKEKSYIDIFEKYYTRTSSRASSHASPANGPIPHQHQLPLHLQQSGFQTQLIPTPQGTPRHLHSQPHQVQQNGHFEDTRMHFSTSQSSSYPSPRSQQQPIIYSPVYSQMQTPYGQSVPQFNMNTGQHMGQMRMIPPAPFMNAAGQPMGTPMMMSPSNGGSMMGVPIPGQMPMYAQNQSHMFPSSVTPIHTQQPIPGTYGSPRPVAPMMVQQGSQQGQMPPSYFMAPPQQNGFIYGQQYPNQMGPMRGPMPSNPQQVYGTSPHLQQHYPVPQQARQQSFGGFPNQVPQNQVIHHPSQGSADDQSRNGP